MNITISSVLANHLAHLPAVREKLSIHPDGLIGIVWGFWGSHRQTLGWISMALGETDRDLDTARRLATEARAEADKCGATMTVLRADLLLED